MNKETLQQRTRLVWSVGKLLKGFNLFCLCDILSLILMLRLICNFRFIIGLADGIIRTNVDKRMLDRESQEFYHLVVTATDGKPC